MKAWIVAAGLLAAAVMPATAAGACTLPANSTAIEAELLGWINAQRASKGLGRLDVSPALRKAAQAHACDMAKRGYLAHEGPGGPSLKTRIKRAGYSYKSVVENIGMDSRANAAAMGQSWRNSPGHWKNLTSRRIDEMGVAFATDGKRVYYVFVGARD